MNLKNLLIEKQEELIGPMDQLYSEIENTIHYDNSTNNKPIENTIPTEDKTLDNTTLDNKKLEIDSNSSDQKNTIT